MSIKECPCDEILKAIGRATDGVTTSDLMKVPEIEVFYDHRTQLRTDLSALAQNHTLSYNDATEEFMLGNWTESENERSLL